jgi:hypothetical protein
MATERQREIFLGVLLVILAGVGYWSWSSSPSTAGGPASNSRSAAATGARNTAPAASPFDVHLKALDDERPKPGSATRNLFRFKPKAPPPRPVQRPVEIAPPIARGPTGPPPPPPITLKFIGILDTGGQAKRIAILSDGTGVSLYGKEGDVVAGQYQILKIGAESIEMAYLDGRGHQVIRLSGT